MKRMDYDEIFTFENLYKAHKKTKKGKLRKEEVEKFDLDKGRELYLLSEELRKRTYRVSPYRTFCIYEPKKRRVDATSYRDRVVQNCFVDNCFYPLLDRVLIDDNASCRKGKGTDYARQRLNHYLSRASLGGESLLSYRNYLKLRSNEYGLLAKIEGLMEKASD